MRDIEHDPRAIMQPRSRAEMVASFLQKDSATRDLVSRLSVLDTTITLPNGKEIKIGMDEVKKYVDREVEYAAIHYPPGYRYYSEANASRKRIQKMEKFFNGHNYLPLIKIFLDLSARSWSIADRMDKRANAMSPEEMENAKQAYDEAVRVEAEISKQERETGRKKEHGIPPFLLEVGGESDRRESNVFLFYAAVLAKEITSSSLA